MERTDALCAAWPRLLRLRGVDGDTIFRCASEFGMTPDLIELVEQGCVAVKTLVDRAAHSGGAKTAYLGLAAEAVFLAGDMLGTVRLLRESIAHENEWCSAEPHVIFPGAGRARTDRFARSGQHPAIVIRRTSVQSGLGYS